MFLQVGVCVWMSAQKKYYPVMCVEMLLALFRTSYHNTSDVSPYNLS
jgi:hypothetical protein